MSGTFWLLIVARVVQAAGTAVMMPLLMTTLMNVVPENDRGRVMGNVTLAMSVAPAMGPAVSGLILNALSWRWMFRSPMISRHGSVTAVSRSSFSRLTDVSAASPSISSAIS